jgi:hypothetical protein
MVKIEALVHFSSRVGSVRNSAVPCGFGGLQVSSDDIRPTGETILQGCGSGVFRPDLA